MKDIVLKPNFNMNDIQNKNILMPNFNYNYNFNLGQMKPINDQKIIDLYNNSKTIFDKLQNIYPNSSMNSNEIYGIYNYSLKKLKESSKENKLEDISKRAHFYFDLYNLINKKKIQHLSGYEYKCSFVNAYLPTQPNNKKIQININNNLFNGAIINNGYYPFNNQNGLLNNNMSNSMNSMNSMAGPNLCNNIIYTIDDDFKINDETMNTGDNNIFLGNKRNLEKSDLEDDTNFSSKDLNKTKKKKKKKRKKKNKNNNNFNSTNQILNQNKIPNQILNQNNNQDKNQNHSINKQNKKKESPMLQIEKSELKKKKFKSINMPKNNLTNNKIHENIIQKNNSVNDKRNNNQIRLRKLEEENKLNEEFINFEKDLKDYLRKTISENRKVIFFNNILSDSRDVMENLFDSKYNIQMNKLYPIYRDNKVELSLFVEPGGKIKKQLRNINI